MSLSVATPLLVAFLLATVRAAAWLVVAPPFSSKAVPGTVKALFAMALALPVAPQLAISTPPDSFGPLVGLVVVQVVVGAALGFLTLLAFAAIESAGNLIDLFGGFSLAASFDPLSSTQNSVFGRLDQMLAVALLFATNLHIVVVAGFLRSYTAVPLTSGISTASMGSMVTQSLEQMLLAALQIAGPLMLVLFLADVGLALMTRVAPSMNAFALGFPLKMLITLTLAGLTLPHLGTVLEALVTYTSRLAAGVGGG